MPAGSFQHGRPRKTKKKEKKKKIESETRNSSAFQWTQFLSLRLLIGCLTGFLPFPHPDFQSKNLKNKKNKKKTFRWWVFFFSRTNRPAESNRSKSVDPRQTSTLNEKSMMADIDALTKWPTDWMKIWRSGRSCRFPVICGNMVLHEEAYCYTEGTDCEKWYSRRHHKDEDRKPPSIYNWT